MSETARYLRRQSRLYGSKAGRTAVPRDLPTGLRELIAAARDRIREAEMELAYRKKDLETLLSMKAARKMRQ
jgi:hypothetical protein